MKLTLIKEPNPNNKYDLLTVEMTTKDSIVSLYDVLEVCEGFIKACGFNFNGSLGIVEDPVDTEEES